MSRILVTGGAGFIGSHLAEALAREGHAVRVLDDLSTGSLENLPNFGDLDFLEGSVCDPSAVAAAIDGCDIAFHLAATVGVRLVVEQPIHTVENNVIGTSVLLREAAAGGVRTLIASTSEVYGKGTSVPFQEDQDVVLGPTSRSRWAYAASKMLDEFMGLAYRQQLGLDVTCVRLFNTVGPRQNGAYGMVLPRFVASALRNEPLRVYGDGSQTRCFCHVKDVVCALVELGTGPKGIGSVVNIGGVEEVSVLDLATRVIRELKSESEIEFVPYEDVFGAHFEDMMRRVPDISLAHKLIGWQPARDMSTIIGDIAADARSQLKAKR